MIFQKMKAIAARWLGKGRQHKAPNTPSVPVPKAFAKAPSGRTLGDYMEARSLGTLKTVARKPKATTIREATQTVPRSTRLIGSERHRLKRAKAALRRTLRSGVPVSAARKRRSRLSRAA